MELPIANRTAVSQSGLVEAKIWARGGFELKTRFLRAAALTAVTGAFAFSNSTAARAASAGSATIDFTYSGSGFGADTNGTGSLTLIDPSTVSSFNFFQTTDVSFLCTGECTSSFNYTKKDLSSSIELSFSDGAPSLSFSTRAVGGTNPDFLPEGFEITENNGGATLGGGLVQSGTVTLDNKSILKAVLLDSVHPTIILDGTKM